MMMRDGDGSSSTMSNDIDERKRKQAEIPTVHIRQTRCLRERACHFLVSQPQKVSAVKRTCCYNTDDASRICGLAFQLGRLKGRCEERNGLMRSYGMFARNPPEISCLASRLFDSVRMQKVFQSEYDSCQKS